MLAHPRNIRPNSGTLVFGVGSGSGSTLTSLYKMGAAAAQLLDFRTRADTASGSDARILYARMHQYGAGGGEAVRAYTFAQNAATATGGTLNGLHATLSIATSSAISGAGNAIRATLEAASATRTLGGTLAALQLDSNIGADNTVGASTAFIRVANVGAVNVEKLFHLPAPSSAGILATHTTQVMSHSIRFVDSAGAVRYIMCTATAGDRAGGA